jgi:hypothetical protein
MPVRETTNANEKAETEKAPDVGFEPARPFNHRLD